MEVATGRFLNLGCGMNADPREGWINLDKKAAPGVNCVHDMTVTPWPIASGTIERIDAIHILEHIPHQVPGTDIDGLAVVMNECWRVMAPGGVMHIEIPTVAGPGAFQDPTHCRYFVHPHSWRYFARFPEQIPGTAQYDERMREIARMEELLKKHEEKDGPDSYEATQCRGILADRRAGGEDTNYHADYGIVCRFDCLQARLEANGFARYMLTKPKE